jgi:hypothetical protein
MAFQAIARSESAVAFFPELERRIREAMDEFRVSPLRWCKTGRWLSAR